MAPIARAFSYGGVPGPNVATYYRRRARGQAGLILTEGAAVGRPAATDSPRAPHFYGQPALAAWQQVAEAVHAAGGKIGPQLGHVGITGLHPSGWSPPAPPEGPSGLLAPGQPRGVAMPLAAIEATISSFGQAAAAAQQLGFDCLELNGADGQLLDQFFRAALNRRADTYGGATLAARSRLAGELVREVRRQVGENFVISLQLSQSPPTDAATRLAASPQELAAWVCPLAEAGVDVFHCPQPRWWEAEFPSTGTALNFAGWVKKVTGKATITGGGVGLPSFATVAFTGAAAVQRSLEEVQHRLVRQEFDLVAVGRALLADHCWAQKVQQGRWAELLDFRPEMLHTLQ